MLSRALDTRSPRLRVRFQCFRPLLRRQRGYPHRLGQVVLHKKARRSTQTAVAFHSGYVRTGGLRFSASAYRRLTTLALRRMTMPRWDLALRQQASLPHISTQGDAAINENARHVAGRCRLLWTFASYGFSWRGFNTAKQANPKLARGFVLQGCEAVEGPVVGASPAAFEILRALL